MFNISSLVGQTQRPQFPPPPPPEQGMQGPRGHRPPPPGQGPDQTNGNCPPPPPPPPNQSNQLQQLFSQFSSQGYMGQSSSLLQNFLSF